MTDQTVELEYNRTGQTVETYPPEWASGAPSSPTCSVYAGTASNDDTAEFSPSVTADTASTTVDQASGYSQANRTRIYLTSTTGIVAGRHYRVTDSGTGACERVTVVGISSGAYVDLDAPLINDYATSSTFEGLRLVFTVDPTWVATESKILPPRYASGLSALTVVSGQRVPSYRARWVYTVGGSTYSHQTYLRLVRKPFKPSVTLADVRRAWPDAELEDGQVGSALLRGVEILRSDIYQAGFWPHQISDSEHTNELALRATLYVLASDYGRTPNGRDPEAYVVEKRDSYKDLFARAIQLVSLGIDEGTEGATSAEPWRQPWLRGR